MARCFGKHSSFHRAASGYKKAITNDLGVISLAAAILWLRRGATRSTVIVMQAWVRLGSGVPPVSMLDEE